MPGTADNPKISDLNSMKIYLKLPGILKNGIDYHKRKFTFFAFAQ
jgi:hypothetical protein